MGGMEPPGQRHPAIDAAQFDVLANADRRHALCTLSTMEQPADLHALALEVTARALGKPTSRVDPEEVRRHEITLYHNHLPRMEDFGLLQFDADDETVELRGSARVETMLETVSGLESR